MPHNRDAVIHAHGAGGAGAGKPGHLGRGSRPGGRAAAPPLIFGFDQALAVDTRGVDGADGTGAAILEDPENL